MADGEPERDDCDTPPRKKHKVKYDQTYKAEYADKFKCVTRRVTAVSKMRPVRLRLVHLARG